MADEKYHSILKIIVVGDSGTGKSNLLTRECKNQFDANSKPTIGVEYMTKNFQVSGSSIKTQIWDTAGQERYKSVTSSLYKGAHGVLIVYDITKQSSFDSVEKWLTEVQDRTEPEITIMLIGNKCDLKAQRQVKTEDAAAYAQKRGLVFFETSALDMTNVESAFQRIVDEIEKPPVSAARQEKAAAIDISAGGVKVQITNVEPQPVEKKKGCC